MMKLFSILFFLIISTIIGCKNEIDNETVYIQKQGYVVEQKVRFGFARRKDIYITVYILMGKNEIKKVTLQDSDFICSVGDPVIVMINPEKPDDMYLAAKKIIEKELLKTFLKEKNMKLSRFFQKQLN